MIFIRVYIVMSFCACVARSLCLYNIQRREFYASLKIAYFCDVKVFSFIY